MTEELALPSMIHAFTITNLKGETTGKLYNGSFVYKRPNLHLEAEIGAMTTQLNRDLVNIPLNIRQYNTMSATLFFCLTKYPDWWRDSDFGRQLYDYNVIKEIYDKCMDFENEWAAKVWAEESPGNKDHKSEQNKENSSKSSKEK